jgi:hypothetical protein
MADCLNIDVWSAAQIWLSGTKLDAHCIAGFSIVWIGRVAKLIAFLSAIPILVDLIGEERILDASQRFRDKSLVFLRANPFRPLLRDRADITPLILAHLLFFGTPILLFGTMAWYIGRLSDAAGIFLTMIATLAIIYGIIFLMMTFLKMADVILANRLLCWCIRITAVSLLVVAFLVDMFVAS